MVYIPWIYDFLSIAHCLPVKCKLFEQLQAYKPGNKTWKINLFVISLGMPLEFEVACICINLKGEENSEWPGEESLADGTSTLHIACILKDKCSVGNSCLCQPSCELIQVSINFETQFTVRLSEF